MYSKSRSILPSGSGRVLTVAVPTYDDIVKVMFDPEGIKRKAQDGAMVIHVHKRNYYGVYLNGSIISLGCTLARSTFGYPKTQVWKAHFDILQTHSHLGRDCLALILEIIPHQRPLHADIPDLYPKFQNFLRKFGFHEITQKPPEIFVKGGREYAYKRFVLD